LSVFAEHFSPTLLLLDKKGVLNMNYSGRQGGRYGGRQGHGKGFKRFPVELGEELEVDIVELSPKGEGIARIQGFVIHIPDTKPGDHVKIRIARVGEKTANAEIIK
jgi:predicted RNA-binding protein with TRAM domain